MLKNIQRYLAIVNECLIHIINCKILLWERRYIISENFTPENVGHTGFPLEMRAISSRYVHIS